MWRLVCLLTLLLISTPLLAVDAPPKRYALLIGVAKYEHSSMNQPEPLKYPEEDAKALGALLKSGGYTVDLVIGKQATLKTIQAKFEGLKTQAEADGVVIVGLFGHGVEIETLDERNEVVQGGCFCPYDTELRSVKDNRGNQLFDKQKQPLQEPDPNTLIKLSDLMVTLKQAKAENRVLFADCCRSVPNQARGRSFGAGFRAQDLPQNTAVLFGCSPNEKAFEHPDWGHGAFTKYLLDELPRLSSEGKVTTGTLIDRLKDRVPKLVASVSPRDRQIPKPFFTDSIDLQLSSIAPVMKPGPSSSKPTNELDDLQRIADDPDYSRGSALYWGLGTKIDEPLAAELLLKAANRNHPLAMGFVARFYHRGEQLLLDTDEAGKWANRAKSRIEALAEKGNPSAQVMMGWFSHFGIGVPQDSPTAAKWYQKAAEQNFSVGQSTFGFMYAKGDGVPKNSVEAIKWFRKAAEQNNAMAQMNFGFMYLNGDGVSKDLVEGIKWIRKAAEQNHPMAQRNLGYYYDSGEGVTRDFVEAVKWYRKAAEQNEAMAQGNLGWMYANGNGVSKDPGEAVKWYLKAAERNNAMAQNNLGAMYVGGEGVPKNPAEAVGWYRKSAERNYATAQNNLGEMYLIGEGASNDPAEAFKWFRKAADQDDIKGEINLANCYKNGSGVTKDLQEAARLYRKALANPKMTSEQKKIIEDFLASIGESR